MNRVVASFTLVVGLAALMIGIYAEQWNVIKGFVIQYVPLLP